MERKRLDQADVASALGVSRSAVNAWINDRAWPANSVGALEELLDISVYDEADLSETDEQAADRLETEARAMLEAARRLREIRKSNPEGVTRHEARRAI